MNILGIIFLLAGGILAASAYIISKKPEAGKLIKKVAPFSDLIGMLLLIWGVWYVIDIIFNLSRYTGHIKADPFWGFVAMLFIPSVAVLTGFMLSFARIAEWIPGQSKSEEKLLALRKKLIKLTTPLGLLAIIAGILHLFRVLF